MHDKDGFKPYIPASKAAPEFTVTAVIIGVILAVVFGAANAYLGLLVGTTITASIPAAVISMGIIRGVLKRNSILENNIVQTIASAGEAVAAGAIFTLPVWFMWQKEWELPSGPSLFVITSIALCGGLLGVFFMIPLRRALIVKEHGTLPYPEGTACAEVLLAGEVGGSQASNVFAGLGIAAIIKFLEDGLKIFPSNVSYEIPSYGNGMEMNISPALLGVGYICGIKSACYMMAGGFISWFVLMPLIKLFGGSTILFPGTVPVASMDYNDIYSNYIKYIGAGAVAAGGIMSLGKSLPTIIKTFTQTMDNFKVTIKSKLRDNTKTGSNNKSSEILRTDKDMSGKVSIISIIAIIFYMTIIPSVPVNVAGAVIIVIFGFFFASVASRLVGIVGSTNNPVSGMTIATLLFTSVAFKITGNNTQYGMISTIVIASIICIASAIAGDTSQDLKTGYIVGATPKYQQYAMIVGTIVSAFAIGGILYLFDASWGFGQGSVLAAPQATLMKVIIEGVMQNNLPWTLVIIGACVSIVMEILGLPSLAIAVGSYLRIGVSACFFTGGVLRKCIESINKPKTKEKILKRKEAVDKGVLYSSGLIAGEGLIGVVLAVLAVVPSAQGTLADTVDLSNIFNLNDVGAWVVFGLAVLSIIAFTFKKNKDKAEILKEE